MTGTTMVTAAAAAAAGRPVTVIVRGQAGCAAAVATNIRQLGGTVTRTLGILDGAAAKVPAGQVAALRANPCVAAVTPDGSVNLSSFGGYDPTADTGSLYNTTQMIGAQAYWKAGYTGKGVGVALIDSGVSPVLGLSGSNKIVNGPDISFDSQSTSLQSLDGFGHGTHMASIIAGRDTPLAAASPAASASTSSGSTSDASGAVTTPVASTSVTTLVTATSSVSATSSTSSNGYAGNTNGFIGVAPDARIINVKVTDAHGASDVSQMIAGIDWTVQHAHDEGRNIRVINLSFGTDGLQSYQLDPLAFAAEQAWLHGIVVVVAAGNGGPNTASLTNPAVDPFVIAVGAADTNGTTGTADDAVASFSSAGSASRSPDLVAPGVHIEGLRVPGSFLDAQFGSTATVAQRFFLGSGTSQATAVVSGAVALMLQQHSGWSPDQVKSALTSTATSLAGQPASLQGSGELNLATALTAPRPAVTQRFPRSTGTGTLDASRGSIHLVNSGVTLTGETDIFGAAWNSSAMAKAEADQSAWNDGTFNGSGWSGSGWSGSGWSNATWTSNAWSGSGWSGSGWSGNTWTGSGWSGSGWSGSGWSGSGWSGSGWSGSGWSGSGWSGSGWSGSGWSGSGWSGSGWSGSGWSDAVWA